MCLLNDITQFDTVCQSNAFGKSDNNITDICLISHNKTP